MTQLKSTSHLHRLLSSPSSEAELPSGQIMYDCPPGVTMVRTIGPLNIPGEPCADDEMIFQYWYRCTVTAEKTKEIFGRLQKV